MYTIIPLLLAHIQELNKQILFLFKFIVKNIPLDLGKSKDDSYTYWKPLNEIKELEKAELMSAKWQILIELSQQLILSTQTN